MNILSGYYSILSSLLSYEITMNMFFLAISSFVTSFSIFMCISDTCDIVGRVGGNFKERLRELGGLDVIFNVLVSCYTALEVSQ